MRKQRELYPTAGLNHEKQTWIAENRHLEYDKHSKHYDIFSMLLPEEKPVRKRSRILSKDERIKRGDLMYNERDKNLQTVSYLMSGKLVEELEVTRIEEY